MKCIVDLGLREGAPVDWPKAITVLKDLSSVVKGEGLTTVRCLESDLYQVACTDQNLRFGKDVVIRWLSQLVLDETVNSDCPVEISGKTGDLSDTWRASLRKTLMTDEDWRAPQILVSADRRDSWPEQQLVTVSVPTCGQEPAVDARSLPLVQIADYASHSYARSDRDPWDVREFHAVGTGDRSHPCLLPKPPLCKDKPIQELELILRKCGVRHSAKVWHYVPPRDWSPATVSPEQWRKGRAFPYGETHGDRGYVDCDAKIWKWHPEESHWDVQLDNGGHQRVTHTGELKS